MAAIEQGDEQLVEAEVLRWSQMSRLLGPLAMCAGAFVMLFQGVRRLWTNWRLILVEALPAMWAWATMLDLKAHVLGGRAFRTWQGPPAIGLVTAAVAVTVSAFYLNTVFAFALTEPEGAAIRPAFGRARRHLGVLSVTGVVVGIAVGVSAFVVPRWGLGWFTFALGIAVGAQMLASVVVPSRLAGRHPSTQPRRDRLVAGVIAGVLGAVICTPSYALGRAGIALLGSHGLLFLGITMLVIGFTLQSGAAGAVKAIKVSTKAAVRPVGTTARAPVPGGKDGAGTRPPAGHADGGANPDNGDPSPPDRCSRSARSRAHGSWATAVSPTR